MKEYDVIASLGGDCAVGYQLRHRGLRMTSLPFDWTRMMSKEPIEYLIRGFQNDFKDLCLKENLTFEGRRHLLIPGGRKEYPAYDTLTGFDFLHLFTKPLTDPGSYPAGRAILDRRIARFISMLGKAKTALLILVTEFAYDEQLARDLAASIRRRFPKLDLTLYLIQFAAKATETIDLGSGDVLCRYQRHLDKHYDMVFTSHEWKFLDTVKLTNLPPPQERKPKGLMRLKYTLWKKYGYELEERGYACCNAKYWHIDKDATVYV